MVSQCGHAHAAFSAVAWAPHGDSLGAPPLCKPGSRQYCDLHTDETHWARIWRRKPHPACACSCKPATACVCTCARAASSPCNLQAGCQTRLLSEENSRLHSFEPHAFARKEQCIATVLIASCEPDLLVAGSLPVKATGKAVRVCGRGLVCGAQIE